jgi:Predicted ATPase
MQSYEKLGAFYLGRPYDLKTKQPKDGLLLYDSKDLVTHAVCVGMTGSGKTGLCIALLEEAAIDGIPAIIIDPKGDLANLLLTFPNLAPQDFEPWVNEEDAEKKGCQKLSSLHSKRTSGRRVLATGTRTVSESDACEMPRTFAFIHLAAMQEFRYRFSNPLMHRPQHFVMTTNC